MQTNTDLENEWKKLISLEIEGREGIYKMMNQDPIRKTSSAFYFRGIRKFLIGKGKHDYQRIIAKEYVNQHYFDNKKSSTVTEADPQEIFLNAYGKNLTKSKLSIFIEILEHEKKRYLIQRQYQSTLSNFGNKGYDKFAKSEEELMLFCRRMCAILTNFKDEVFKGYRSCEKQSKNQPVCLIHQSITPQNIVIFENEQDKYYLIDYSNAVVGLKDSNNNKSQMKYGGTINPVYQAPQSFNQQRYNEKVDIWSFGCILYEILCGNYKFITNLKNFDKRNIQTYVNKQFKVLELKLAKRDERCMPSPEKWIKIVRRCLQIDFSQRIDVQQLKNLIEETPSQMNNRQQVIKKFLFQSNIFEMIRLSTISDKISQLFEQIYLSEQECLKDYRWLIYGVIKTACLKFTHKYGEVKSNSKQLYREEPDKQRISYHFLDGKRINSILNESKITQKIKKYFNTFKLAKEFTEIRSQIIKYFPDTELIDESEGINLFDSIIISQKLKSTNAYQIILDLIFYSSDYHVNLYKLSDSSENQQTLNTTLIAETEFCQITKYFQNNLKKNLLKDPIKLKEQFSLLPPAKNISKLVPIKIEQRSS